MGYNAPNDELMKRIQKDRDDGWKNPYAFKDEDILRREPNEHDKATLARPAFARDIEKVLNIPAYNRYNGKTQVFSFFENDDICRRGLHVQLVSRIARSIGDVLGLNTLLIEAIALSHDLGHTPFGHAGEYILSDIYYERTDHKYKFSHNVNSVRVMDKLYPRNISLQTLDGALCHNGEFEQQVLRVGDTHDFATLGGLVEACDADEANIAHLRPSTLEGCVVRVADIVAYVGKDRDDALEMGVLENLDCFDTTVLGRDNSTIIHNLTTDIVNNSYGRDHIAMSAEIFADLKTAKRQNYELIYDNEGMVGETKNLVEDMFARMYERLLEDVLTGREDSPIVTLHTAELVKCSRSWTVDAYLSIEPNRIVCDYISSMTDDYFLSLYRELFPADGVDEAIAKYYRGIFD